MNEEAWEGEWPECLKECATGRMEGFSLNYQPLIRAKDRCLSGCEALLRWSHPDIPVSVSPCRFIPILEKSGLILNVGNWVLKHALQQCADWEKRIPGFQMNINVSCQQFEVPDFPFFVIDTVNALGVKPASVVLELTESEQIQNTDQIGKVFDFLRSQGIRIALDDFGTGYASLEILRALHADELKVDRSFIERITYDVVDQKIVMQVIRLCHDIHMRVCVEGVETMTGAEIVTELGADLLQGNYFSAPLTAKEFERMYLQEMRADSRESLSFGFDGNLAEVLRMDQKSKVERRLQPMGLDELVDHVSAGIFEVKLDLDLSFLSCNEGYRKILGYTAKEIDERFRNRSLGFVAPEDLPRLRREIRRQLEVGETITVSFRVVKSNGTTAWILSSGNVVRGTDGQIRLVMVALEMGKEEEQKAASTDRESEGANADPVTGLLNKREMEQLVSKRVREAGTGFHYAMFLIDLDDFRKANSRFGHPLGDQILIRMAERLKAAFDRDAVLGRSGGDEFLAFTAYDGTMEALEQKGTLLVEQMRRPLELNGQSCEISVSVGISCYPEDGARFAVLFERALGALYQAKARGKNGYVLTVK